MAADDYKVGILDGEGIVRLIHSLAFVKTLATKSKVEVGGVSLSGQATHASIGENYNQLQFKRWVGEERQALYKQFQEACQKGPASSMQWLKGANKARNQYFRNYQSTIESLNRINADLVSAYTFSMRTAAVVQYAAETTLIVYGLVGGAANMTVNLALKKFALGVGSGISISLAEDWAAAESADLLITPAGNISGTAGSNLVMNLPGTIDDTFRNICNLLNSWTISKLQKQLNNINEQIKTTVAQKNSLPKGQRAPAQNALKELYKEQKQIGSKIKNPGNAYGKLGTGFTLLNWGLSIKAEIDSTNKFLKHWNGEL